MSHFSSTTTQDAGVCYDDDGNKDNEKEEVVVQDCTVGVVVRIIVVGVGLTGVPAGQGYDFHGS